MTATLEKLKSELGDLSESERAEFAFFLLESLEPADENVEEAWREEIGRRVARLRAGESQEKSADEVFNELRKNFP